MLIKGALLKLLPNQKESQLKPHPWLLEGSVAFPSQWPSRTKRPSPRELGEDSEG